MGTLAYIHNLSDLAVWTSGGSHAKARFTWTYSDPDGGSQSAWRIRIYDDAAKTNPALHDTGKVAGIDTSYDSTYALVLGTEYWYTLQVWDDMDESSGESSTTAFKVRWGQAMYEYNAGTWAAPSFQSAEVAANTYKTVIFRGASGPESGAPSHGPWVSSVGSVDSATYPYLQVLVRLATTASGTQPGFTDMILRYTGANTTPDHWTTSGTWTLDNSMYRYGSRSFRCNVASNVENPEIYPYRFTVGDDVFVQELTEYMFSVFVKTDGALGANSKVRLAIYSGGAGGTLLLAGVAGQSYGDGATSDSSAAPEGWKRLVLRYKTEIGQQTLRVKVQYINGGAGAGDVFWVDAGKAEPGTVASSWAPGWISPAVVIDSFGIQIDGSAGATFRLRNTVGDTTVDLDDLVTAGSSSHPTLASHDAMGLATDTELSAHINDTTDAHDASAISILDTADDFTATDVEGALAELQADNEAHVAASDPHTGYRLESADHSHASTGLQGGSTLTPTTLQILRKDASWEGGEFQMQSAYEDTDVNVDLFGSTDGNEVFRIHKSGTVVLAINTSGAKTTPSTQAFGDAAAVGTSNQLAFAEHKHAMPSDPKFAGAVTNSTATGAITGLAISNAVFRWDGASSATIHGIAGGAEGRVIFIENVSTAQVLSIANQSGTEGTAANRLITGNNTLINVRYGASVMAVYDATSSRWRVESLGTSATAAAAVGTASAGTEGNLPSRSDHVHPASGDTPSTQAFGDAAATGTSAKAAQSDHKHAMPADPVTAHVAASDPHTGYRLESASIGTTDIADDAVTYAKMQNVSATDKLLGRATAGAGDVEEITLTSAGRALLDDATAAAQATTLGLGTGDSPQFTAVNVGHATDTTITRVSAGNLAVEGNALYRAGGTDVPVADGGTGASTAAAARTNLDVQRLHWFNAKDYGVTGDGTTDDTSAINAAIVTVSAANYLKDPEVGNDEWVRGGVLYFPPGLYSIGTIHLRDNVYILGAGHSHSRSTSNKGAYLTRFKQLGSTNAPAFFVPRDVVGNGFEKFSLEGQKDVNLTGDHYGIQLEDCDPTSWAGGTFSVTGEADTNLFTAVAHGLAINDSVFFTARNGGAGLTTGGKYWIIADGYTADTFKLSTTFGGTEVDFTTDVVATSTLRFGHAHTKRTPFRDLLIQNFRLNGIDIGAPHLGCEVEGSVEVGKSGQDGIRVGATDCHVYAKTFENGRYGINVANGQNVVATDSWYNAEATIYIGDGGLGFAVPLQCSVGAGVLGPTYKENLVIGAGVKEVNVVGVAFRQPSVGSNDVYSHVRSNTTHNTISFNGCSFSDSNNNAKYDFELTGTGTVTESGCTHGGGSTAITDQPTRLLTDITSGAYTAKGTLLSASSAGVPAALAVGADDTILMADAAQTTGLKWVASATPVAVGTANAAGTSDDFARGSHVHAHETAHVAHDTVWDAKGDLVSGSGADTAVKTTVGADDTILMADAAASGGIKWVAAATPSTQAFGDSASAGTGDSFTRGDHKHAMPANPVTAHEGAADPHTGYQKESEKEVASGYLGINSYGFMTDPSRSVNGYITTGKVGDGTDYWTKIASGSLNAAFDSQQGAAWLHSNNLNISTPMSRGRIYFRVHLSSVYPDVEPQTELVLYDGQGALTGDRISLVVTSITGPVTWELYVRLDYAWEQITVVPISSLTREGSPGDTYTTWYAAQTLDAALPSGTTITATVRNPVILDPLAANTIAAGANILPLRIKSYAGGTNALTDWYDYNGNQALYVDKTGFLLSRAKYSDASVRLYLDYYNVTTTTGPSLYLRRYRSETPWTHGVVALNDQLGAVVFAGSDGTTTRTAAQIRSDVDASTVSDTSMPGRLMFYTTPVNSTSMVERLRIDNAGVIYIGASTTVPSIRAASGDPESNQAARIGSIYFRTDGGAGTSIYIKESGTSTTGWVALASNSSAILKAPSAAQTIVPTADAVALIVKGGSVSYTSDIFQVQSYNGTQSLRVKAPGTEGGLLHVIDTVSNRPTADHRSGLRSQIVARGTARDDAQYRAMGAMLNISDDAGVHNATISGAANNGSGLIRITATGHAFVDGESVAIYGVAGTTEANGQWYIDYIDANTFDLLSSTFTNTYTSGGTATNRPMMNGMSIQIGLNVARDPATVAGTTAANGEDVGGLTIFNASSGVGVSATEGIYITQTASNTGRGFVGGVNIDANCQYGFHLGAREFEVGLQFRWATFTGSAILLPNDASISALTTGAAVRSMMRLNASNELALGAPVLMNNINDAAKPVLLLKAHSSQSSDILSVQDSAGNASLRVNSSNQIALNANVVIGASAGVKFGTATSQKIGFFNATPIIQPASANQAAAPAGGTGAVEGAYDTAAHRDALITLVNEMRTVLVNLGLMKGSA